MQIKNVSAYGGLDVPLLARQGEPYEEHAAGCVAAGEVLDVTEDQARRLLPQRDNFEPVDADAKAVAAELDEQLAAANAAAADGPEVPPTETETAAPAASDTHDDQTGGEQS